MSADTQIIDAAVDAVNALFDEMIAGKGDDADLQAYSRLRLSTLRTFGFTELTFRAACRARLEEFAQANTHGVIAAYPPED